MDEERLTGGNTSVVVRVGDTVRRPAGSWTPAVHDLLAHLESVGFTRAPRVLGVDEVGREILGFVPDPASPWRRAPGGVLRPDQVIVHHDVSPYNTVRRGDGSLVVLDWDFARPGDPIEGLAWAAWRWAPLMAGTWWHREYGIRDDQDVRAHQQRNLAALLDGYGPSPGQRRVLPEAIHQQMTSHAADLEDMARTDPAFADLIRRNHAQAARDDAQWWHTTTFSPG